LKKEAFCYASLIKYSDIRGYIPHTCLIEVVLGLKS
jgi:hypothetical protein